MATLKYFRDQFIEDSTNDPNLSLIEKILFEEMKEKSKIKKYQINYKPTIEETKEEVYQNNSQQTVEETIEENKEVYQNNLEQTVEETVEELTAEEKREKAIRTKRIHEVCKCLMLGMSDYKIKEKI